MEGQSIWLTFLTSIIPFVIIFILFFFLINQAQGGGGKVMNFGKSRARFIMKRRNALRSRMWQVQMKRSKSLSRLLSS